MTPHSTHRPRDGLGLTSRQDGAVGWRGDLDSARGGGEEEDGSGEHCYCEGEGDGKAGREGQEGGRRKFER